MIIGVIRARTGRVLPSPLALYQSQRRGARICAHPPRSTHATLGLEDPLGTQDRHPHAQRLLEHLAQLATALVVQVDADVAHPIPYVPLILTCLESVDHIEIEQRAGRTGAHRITRRCNRTTEVLG